VGFCCERFHFTLTLLVVILGFPAFTGFLRYNLCFLLQLLQCRIPLVPRWGLQRFGIGVRRPGQNTVWGPWREEISCERCRRSQWSSTSSLHHATHTSWSYIRCILLPIFQKSDGITKTFCVELVIYNINQYNMLSKLFFFFPHCILMEAIHRSWELSTHRTVHSLTLASVFMMIENYSHRPKKLKKG